MDQAILALRDKGLSYRLIAQALSVGQDRVSQVLHGKRPGRGRGRPPGLTQEIRTYVEANWLADARITDRQMTAMVNARFGTKFTRRILNAWRNMLRILYRPPLRVQVLTKEQKDYSYQWAEDLLAQMNAAEEAGRPMRIVFSDESRFCLDSDRRWVRYRRGEWNATAMRLMAKFPKGVMVWGAIGPGYKSPLIRCSAGVGSAEYLKILEDSEVVVRCNQLYGHRQWHFQQDGAPAHKAGLTLASLYQSVNVLAGWPPNRCDLNPIEMAWSVAGASLDRDGIKTENELFEAIQAVWDGLDMSVTNRLVASFKRRLEMVVEVRGNTISQLLSSHMDPRPQDVREGVIATFTEDDDMRLREGVHMIGRHWQRIQNEIVFSAARTALELRMRYDYLEGQDRNELAMKLEREYVHGRQEMDVMLEVGFAAETGDDSELALVRPPDPGSSDEDEEPPRYAPSQPGFLAFSSARVAALRSSGDRRPLTRMVRDLRGEWNGLSAEERIEWTLPPAWAAPPRRRAPRRRVQKSPGLGAHRRLRPGEDFD